MRIGDVIECDAALPREMSADDHRSVIGKCAIAPGIPYVRSLSYYSDALSKDGFEQCDSLHLMLGGLWPPVDELPENRTAKTFAYLRKLVHQPVIAHPLITQAKAFRQFPEPQLPGSFHHNYIVALVRSVSPRVVSDVPFPHTCK